MSRQDCSTGSKAKEGGIKTGAGSDAESSGTDTLSSVPAGQEMINLLMVGRGECWIEVSIDGDSSFSEIMKTQDTLWLAMQDSITFKLGRANNVDVWCNAQPLALAAD